MREIVESCLLVLLIGPLVPGQDQSKLDRLVQTGTTLTSLDVVTSINDAGWVAFTGTASGVSRGFVVREPDAQQVITFGDASRIFFGAAINNETPIPRVATRDRVVGSPPLFFMRGWVADGSQTYALVGGSNAPANFDSCAGQCDINDSGVIAFSGLTNGSTQTVLFAGSTRPPTPLASHPGNVLIRPQIANDGRIVYRDHQSQIVECRYPIGGCATIAGAPFSTTGLLPGISRDGTVIAFAGNRGAGNGVFVTFVSGASRYLIRVAGEGQDAFTTVDDTQRCSVVARDLGNTGRAFTVTVAGTYAGRQGIYAVLITTYDDNGTVRHTVSHPAPLVRAGDDAGGVTLGAPILYDSMNVHGSVSVQTSIAGGSAIVRATPYPLFTQTDGRWCADKYGNYSGTCPSPRVCSGSHGACCPETIRRWGCMLTSVAVTLRSLGIGRGVDDRAVDPQNLNAWLRGTPDGYRSGDSGCNQSLNLGKVLRYSRGQIRYEERRNWQAARRIMDAAAELSLGNRLILRVRGTSGPEGHKVVALGYDPDDARGPTLRIHDPFFPARVTLHDGPYGNTFASAVALVPVAGPRSLPWMEITARSPVEMVVTDPMGRRSGFNPRTNQAYDEIPGASYFAESTEEYGGGAAQQVGPKTFVNWQPLDGTYRFDVHGVGTGPYSIVVNSVDSQGTSDSILVAEGNATPTSLDQWTTGFSATRGARRPGITFEGDPSTACAGPCLVSPSSDPLAGSNGFGIWVSNAPALAPSVLIIGSAARPDFLTLFGAAIHIDLSLSYALVGLATDVRGRVTAPLPLPLSLRNRRVSLQFVALETGPCERRNDLTNSSAMTVLVQ